MDGGVNPLGCTFCTVAADYIRHAHQITSIIFYEIGTISPIGPICNPPPTPSPPLSPPVALRHNFLSKCDILSHISQDKNPKSL